MKCQLAIAKEYIYPYITSHFANATRQNVLPLNNYNYVTQIYRLNPHNKRLKSYSYSYTEFF